MLGLIIHNTEVKTTKFKNFNLKTRSIFDYIHDPKVKKTRKYQEHLQNFKNESDSESFVFLIFRFTL